MSYLRAVEEVLDYNKSQRWKPITEIPEPDLYIFCYDSGAMCVSHFCEIGWYDFIEILERNCGDDFIIAYKHLPKTPRDYERKKFYKEREIARNHSK